VPWTARVGGPPSSYTFEGFGGATLDHGMSNLTAPDAHKAPSLLAKALKTTRREQIDEHREGWRKGLRTASGAPRKNLPNRVLVARATALRAAADDLCGPADDGTRTIVHRWIDCAAPRRR